MAFGVRRNLHYPKLTDAVINRILDNPSALALRDLVSLMNFVTRVKIMSSEENRKKLYEAVLKRIGEIPDEGRNVRDVADVVQCLTYLSGVGVRGGEGGLVERILRAANSSLKGDNSGDAGRTLTRAVFGELFPKSLSQLPSGELGEGDFSRLAKNVASIDASLEIDAAAELRLRREVASALRVSLQEQVPLEAHSPLMKLNTLSQRHQVIIRAMRTLNRLSDGDGYCELCYLLPQYPEADLVMGHIAGTLIHVAPDLKNKSNGEIKPAPEVGEWTVISINVPEGPIRSLGYEAALHEGRTPRKGIITGRKMEPLMENREPPIPAPWSVSGQGQNSMVKHAQLKKIGYSVVSVNGLRLGETEHRHNEDILQQVLYLILFDKSMDPKIASKV